ncbi:hypothetical protein SNOG_07027 [Parastagonospora nodorum SN15]|uniref:Uncharacterized protein n=1 Tax=Phaeosphaeria nodorum (strain SN15 / ATCC MYA-4574 / FGSC 10173) TaxID=321614 RepID=Q0UMI7_PHANO|nr:hypothetical protein SNOG_07027 [Parastagonospora nodorum SN15]EAT85678.1 hypothetical protein SNOG_07027 [Parastagonospora nodorum SN15]
MAPTSPAQTTSVDFNSPNSAPRFIYVSGSMQPASLSREIDDVTYN